MLTAYTLYTYKKSRGYTDNLHPSAAVFIPGPFTQRLSPSVGLTRAPVRIPPREAHLPGRPADTFLLSVTFRGGGRPDWPADTFPSRVAPGRMGGGVPVVNRSGFIRSLPVAPDFSGALPVCLVDWHQFVPALFLVMDSDRISLLYEKL